MNRQKLILTVLAGLFVLALAYAFWATPRLQQLPATGIKRRASQRPVAASRVKAPDNGSRVHLDLLKRKKRKFPGYKRDIFNYPRVTPPPPPKVVKLPPAPPPPAPPVAVIGEAPLIPPAVERALARFTFLGFLLKDGEKTVFLSSEGEIFVVKKGERFGRDQEFLVTEVTAELLTIRQGSDPRAITIPLMEQAPLVPSATRMPTEPFTGRGSPFRQGAGFKPGEERQAEERAVFPPEEQGNHFPPVDEGNVFPPEEQGNHFPPVDEGNIFPPEEETPIERDVLPPGGTFHE